MIDRSVISYYEAKFDSDAVEIQIFELEGVVSLHTVTRHAGNHANHIDIFMQG